MLQIRGVTNIERDQMNRMPTSKKIAAKFTKKPATATSKSASAALEGKKAPAFELLDAGGKSVMVKLARLAQRTSCCISIPKT